MREFPRWRGLAAGLVAVASLSASGPAFAICAAPADAIVWSSPADGATGVPTNADLLFIATGFTSAEPIVTLDGNAIDRASDARGHYELGDLAPMTTHTIAFTAPGIAPLEVSFETASEPMVGDDRIIVGSTSTFPPHRSDYSLVQAFLGEDFTTRTECVDAIYAGTCFDTGAPSAIAFDADVQPTAWVVERVIGETTHTQLIPGSCGRAVVLGYSEQQNVTFYGLELDGTTRATEVDSAGALADGGCSTIASRSAGTMGVPCLVLIVLGGAVRRFG